MSRRKTLYLKVFTLAGAVLLGSAASLGYLRLQNELEYMRHVERQEILEVTAPEDLASRDLMNVAIGFLSEGNYEKGIQYYKVAAERNIPDALYKIGYWKAHDFIDVSPDARPWVEDFEQAAVLGHWKARFVLEVQEVLALDHAPKGFEAAHWLLEKDSQQGNIEATHKLCAYGKEKSSPIFYGRHNFEYCFAALGQGYAPTQYIMGLMYEQDTSRWDADLWAMNGLEQDLDKAMALYQASAAQGYDPAIQHLKDMSNQ